MSVESQESIYNLIPPFIPPLQKHVRYRSKFRDNVKQDARRNLAGSKTMGPAKVITTSPKDFLKKHSKEPKLAESSSFKYPDQSSRKPPVPSHKDHPPMPGKSGKNFITTNAIANITAVPKKPVPKYVDTPAGATHCLEESGLVPKYIHKKEYGQVPLYLQQHRKEMAEAQASHERYIQECIQRGQMEQLSAENRQKILEGLKKNWDQIHHEYQGLSVVTDTPAKKARKERMEAEMKQLEKDIELFEKHPVIYIDNAK